MGILNQVAQYLFIKKRNPNETRTFNVKAMHGINRISIFMFILCLIILTIKLLRN